MNLEFQSAGKPTINGSRGLNAKTETPAANPSKGHERSAQFKNLLDQSKQDIKQADYQLEKVRENRRESKAIAESNRQEEAQRLSKDIQVTSDQAEEPVTEKLKSDENQENSSLSTLETAQLMGVQSFQGGIETALTRLNLKLGLDENEVPEGLNDQGQVSILTDMDGQLQNMAVLENTPLMESMSQAGSQGLQQNIGNVEMGEVEGRQGLLNNSGSQLAATEETNKTVDPTQQLVTQTGSDDDSESQMFGGIKQVNGDQTKDGKSETLNNVISGNDSTEEQISEQPKVFDGQLNPLNQTENQNPGERGVQEINVMGSSASKGSEVQPDVKVEVAQQVQQKILQNFEPNKPMVLQMTLSPDNLGDIDIKLSYDQGKLIIDITAISRETQNLLGKQINLLVRGLALQNVQVETVHVNSPVEQSSDSQDATFMMNGGSDPNENQNQTLLRERFIKNSGVLNSILTSSDEDESVLIPQNLQNYTNHKVNYLI
jgi:flagellar hook-length control protein FliK